MKQFIQALLFATLLIFTGCSSDSNTTSSSTDTNVTDTNTTDTNTSDIITPTEGYTVVKRVDNIGSIDVITEYNSKLYLANSDGLLYVYSLSNPSSPQLLASYDTGDTVEDIAVVDDTIYVANNQNGLLILTLNQENAFVDVTSLSMSGYARGVDVENNTIYIASGYGGINSFDLTTLTKYDAVDVEGDFTDSIVIKDNYAITSDAYNSFSTVTNIAQKEKVAQLEKPHSFYEARDDLTFTHDKNTLFLADGTGGFKIFDVSNIEAPVELVSTESLTKDAQHITLSQDESLAFVSTLNNGIDIYEIYGFDHANLVEHVDLNESMSQVVGSSDSALGENGEYLYIAAKQSGLIVLALPFKTTPIIAPSISLLDITNWDVYGSAAYVMNNLVVGDDIGYDSDDVDNDSNIWNALADGSTQYDYDVVVSTMDLTPPIRLNFTGVLNSTHYGYNEIGIGLKSENFTDVIGEGIPVSAKATFNLNWETPDALEVFVTNSGYINTSLTDSTSFSGDFSIDWDGNLVSFYYDNILVAQEPLTYKEGEVFKIFIKTYESSFNFSKVELN